MMAAAYTRAGRVSHLYSTLCTGYPTVSYGLFVTVRASANGFGHRAEALADPQVTSVSATHGVCRTP